jgi:Na+-driven multidrug efflux pump
MNFSAALATFVGQNIGAGKSERVRRGLISTLLMSSAVSLSVMTVVILLKYQLMGMFTDDPDVRRIGGEYLLIVSSFYLLFTVMFKINGVLRGAGDTLIPMFITLTSLWIIRVPFAWYFSGLIGETGIWWSQPAGWGVGLALSFGYYLTGRWKKMAVVKHGAYPAGPARQTVPDTAAASSADVSASSSGMTPSARS